MKTSTTNVSGGMRHAEAYKLMNYRCRECGHHEILWNSRDGVTPFCIPCSKCNDPMGMTHVDWNSDRFSPWFSPTKGQRYFADMTRMRARELANSNADILVSRGDIEQNDRNRCADRMFEDYFGDGHNPDILEATC